MLEYYFIDKKTRIKNPKSIVFSTAIEEKLVGEILKRNHYEVRTSNVEEHVKGIDLFIQKDVKVDVKTVNDLNSSVSITKSSIEAPSVEYYAFIIGKWLYMVRTDTVKSIWNEETSSISTEEIMSLPEDENNKKFELLDDEASYYNNQKNIYKTFKLSNRNNVMNSIDEISSELYPLYYERYKKYFRVRF